MDLETLQVVLEMNTEKVQAGIDKILPSINNMMGKIERVTGKSMDQTEKNLDIDKGATNIEKQLEKMNNIMEKQMAVMEKVTERTSANVGKSMSKGFAKGRTQVNKDVDALVKDINAKMMQAKSQQEKLAFLKTQRQAATNVGDTSGVVKFDEQIANAQAAMTRYQTSAENLARTMRREFISLPKSLEGISTAMDKNEAQIESMRSKIRNLQVTYNDQLKPVGSFGKGFEDSGETKSSAKTAALIDKQTAAMNKLIAENDNLQQAYAKTQDRARALSPVISKLNTTLGSTEDYQATSKNVDKVGDSIGKSRNKLGMFSNLFNRTSRNMSKSGPSMNKPFNSVNKTLRSFVRRLLIAGLAYKSFAGMASYMGKAVLSNEQFSKSLNEVKVNLATAFYPIYTAVMPALNALISWLSKATAYMASFIATLFGTTYSAAKKGASALNENIAAMGDTGANADKAKEKVKKFQNVLAGFDEINTLDFKTDSDDDSLTGKGPANGIDFGIADPGIPAWLNTFADRFKSVLKDLFAPIKAAWDKHGKKVMDAWKYALSEVGGLISSIGKSFMEVWTNGTGERFVGNLLILLADVLNIIGDIAKAFKDAWNNNNRGTKLIQSIFNAWNGVLELLHEIAVSFRKAWNNGNGERIAGHLLEIFTNIFKTIGNIADGLKKAWREGDNGTSIFDSILGTVGDILGHINDVTDATEKWAKKLDFTPLLSSIAGLFKNIRPVVDNIGAGLSWLYRNILLPIAKWAIENALPVAIDAISEAFRFLGNVIERAKPVLSWLWENLLKPMGKWVGKKLVAELESIRDGFKFLADAVENPKKAFAELSDKTLEKFKDLKEKGGKVWGSVVEFITGGSKKSKDDAKFNFDELEVNSSSVFGNIGKLVSKIFPNLSKTISENTEAAKKSVVKNWTEVSGATVSWFGKVWSKTKDTWEEVSSKVTTKAKSAYDAASGKWKELSENTSTRFGEVSGAAKTKFTDLKDSVSKNSQNARDNAIIAWSVMKDRTGEYMTNIKDSSKKGFDQVVSWASDLGGRISKGLRDGIDGVKKAAKEMSQGLVNALGKGVNGTIKGVNWVLDKVGSDKKLAEWKVPEYAKGTNRHPGGPALVNDAPGSTYQEAYELPDGTKGLFPKVRNMMVDLPANTKVLTAARTAKEQIIPQYKNGVGNWLSEKWNGAKELAGDVWDYVKKPEELVKNAISKFTNLSKVKDPGLSIAKGAISTASSGAIQMVKDAFAFGGGGGVNFQGLVKTSDFGWRTHPITGQRKLHAGVDYGGGGGIGHPIHAQTAGKVKQAGPSGSGYGTWVNMQKGVYDYIYAHLSKALVSRGDNVKAGQKIGLMGSTGDSTGPHVHYEVRKNGSPINPETVPGVGLAAPAGRGVERWRSTIQRALSMNGLPANAVYTNAWLRQVQSESGGNEKAVQGNIGDINNRTGDLAKGLLQTISATFNAYKHSGHGNIFNGYDNALAAINYAKNRYGSTSMLGVIGHGHGYDNGGLIRQEQMIRVGEGNNDEMIIPLTKPSRALELIAQSLDYMGMDFGDLTMPTALQPSYESFALGDSSFDSSGSTENIESMADSMSSAFKKAITVILGEKQESSDSGPIEVTMVVDSDTFGKIAIKSINKQTKKTGKPQIIM
ncbi:peptidoglycan DD-metalloendopeptidase family protein [Carnobacterium mobile]|uniref:peptidoglycan DD-metalloendopeptidase family protein n=1 Tax=Carnobacterium mobile TaxID=2750 RepID=UPI000556530E|nr:peptidoglycan DD-metalloendopeptidase family protein [Carnobacterium mobile]